MRRFARTKRPQEQARRTMGAPAVLRPATGRPGQGLLNVETRSRAMLLSARRRTPSSSILAVARGLTVHLGGRQRGPVSSWPSESEPVVERPSSFAWIEFKMWGKPYLGQDIRRAAGRVALANRASSSWRFDAGRPRGCAVGFVDRNNWLGG